MNSLRSFLAAAVLSLLLFSSCKTDSKPTPAAAEVKPRPDTICTEPVSTEGARGYVITEGIVYWQGKKSIGESHNGTIRVKGGELLINEGQLLSGQVTLDMSSIAVSDLEDPGERAELESHLRSPDFFDVKGFPLAEFKFEEVLPNKTPNFNAVIIGQLTMKGKTNAVNIPIRLEFNGDELSAESPAFLINRTLWAVNFRSGVLGTAQDKMIEDTVPLSLKIKAKAKT